MESKQFEYRPCDLKLMSNVAIAMTYLCVGVVLSILNTPLSVYLVEDLSVEPAVQSTISILRFLPWSFKLIFGFISDSFPISGFYRKPYLLCGILLHSVAFMGFYFVNQLSIAYLAASVFFGTAGLIQMDVMADTLCVQRSKYENEEQRGQLQSTCYAVRFGGSLLGAVLGAVLFNRSSWGWGLSYPQFSLLVGTLPLFLILPCLYHLVERYDVPPPASPYEKLDDIDIGNKPTAATKGQSKIVQLTEVSPLISSNRNHAASGSITSVKSGSSYEDITTKDLEGNVVVRESSILHELHEIWYTVQLRSVWQPMIFVFIFNFLQVYNVAWQSYLQLTLNFTPWKLGIMSVFASLMSFLGILLYKSYLMHVSWRLIFLGTVVIAKIFTLLQLLLILHVNRQLHLSDYIFSLGDDVVTAYISGVRFLPVYIMYMRLCPQGSEGATYSMLTTMGNIATICTGDVANLLSQIWNVSNEALERGDTGGLWRLTILTSVVGIVPLALLNFLPRNAHEQDVDIKAKQRSPFAGAIFLIVLLLSITWAVVSAIDSIYNSRTVHRPEHVMH